MEFRIAPLIMAFINLLFIISINPNFNEAIALSSVANIYKMLIPFVLIYLLSIGTYARHSYYSMAFRVTFYSVQLLNLFLAADFVYVIKNQHVV